MTNPSKYFGICTTFSKVSQKGTIRSSMNCFPDAQKFSNYKIYSNLIEEEEKGKGGLVPKG